MRTRLLIRPNSDIRILDTEFYDESLVALRVDNIEFYDIQVGDVLSLNFDNPSINPGYEGQWQVVRVSPTQSCCLSDPHNSIVLSLPWNGSTDTNTGWARNYIRYTEDGLLSSVNYNWSGNVLGGASTAVKTGNLLSDGTIILGGNFTTYGTNTATASGIVGVNIDGSINPSFAYGSGFSAIGGPDIGEIKIDSDDGVYVVGRFTSYQGVGAVNVIKLTSTASIDTSFNSGTGLNASPTCIQLDEENSRMYIGGAFSAYDGNSSNRISRISDTGSFDSTFITGTGFNNTVSQIALDEDGKVYVVGLFTNYNGTACNRICRLTATGSYDSSFTIGTGFNNSTSEIKIIDGKIYVSGRFTSYNGTSSGNIIRLNTDGTVDTTFNVGVGFNGSGDINVIVEHQSYIYVGGAFTTYKGASASKIVVLDYYGNMVPGNSNVFNNTVLDLLPIGEDLLVMGLFTSNGKYSNRVSIFRSYLKSIRLQTEELNLREDIQFPLTFNISDIKEPQNRKSDYSKTITLPGTDHNNQVLAQLFEIGADSTYNTNQKKDVFVLQDGLEIFRGFIKIDNINRENWNDVTYDVKISGKLTDIFSKLFDSSGKDLKISDLDFSEYEHNRDRNAIINSWIGEIQRDGTTYSNYDIGPSYSVTDTSFVDGNYTRFNFTGTHSLELGDVVYFEMDYPNDLTVGFQQSQGHHTVIGTSASSIVANLAFGSGGTNSGVLTKWSSRGEGYVYPTIDFGNQLTTFWNIGEYVPNVYVKTIVDKIFDYIKFSYDSEFFEGEYFKRLVYLGNNKKFDNMIWTHQNFDDTTSVTTYTTNEIKSTPFPETISATFTMVSTHASNVVNNFFFGLISDWVTIQQEVDVIWTVYDTSGSVVSTTTTLILQGNVLVSTVNIGVANLSGLSGQIVRITSTSPLYNLTPGQYVGVKYVKRFYTNSNWQASTVVRSYNLTPYNFSISDYLGTMTCRDLLISLISMHNLYMEPDKNNERKLVIEPFNMYYRLDLDAEDWTDKVNPSQIIEIKPVSPEVAKNYSYSYLDDGDFLNKNYKDSYSDIYGKFEISQETDFNNDTISTEVKLAQTPLLDRSDNTPRIIIPTIVKDVSYSKIDSFKPRIFYWTGLRFANNPGTFSMFSINALSTGSVGSGSLNNPSGFGLPMFGYAGHFDNPENATLDLNFGINERYYYGDGYQFNVTANTLFRRYYRDYYNEITDHNTKLLTCYMKLNSFDISNLSFRRLYYIKDNLYRLQSIKDYDPLTSDTSICEFIKVRIAPSLDPSLSDLYNEPTLISDGFPFKEPLRTPQISVGNNIFIDDDSLVGSVVGTGITISVAVSDYSVVGVNLQVGTGSRVISAFGENVRVGQTASNIFIAGKNITINDGLENVYVLGNDITATQSNSFYFDPSFNVYGLTVSGGTSSLQDLQSVLDEGNTIDSMKLEISDDGIILGGTNNTVTNSLGSLVSGEFHTLLNSPSSLVGGLDANLVDSEDIFVQSLVSNIYSSIGNIFLANNFNATNSNFNIMGGTNMEVDSISQFVGNGAFITFSNSSFVLYSGADIYADDCDYFLIQGPDISISGATYGSVMGQHINISNSSKVGAMNCFGATTSNIFSIVDSTKTAAINCYADGGNFTVSNGDRNLFLNVSSDDAITVPSGVILASNVMYKGGVGSPAFQHSNVTTLTINGSQMGGQVELVIGATGIGSGELIFELNWQHITNFNPVVIQMANDPSGWGGLNWFKLNGPSGNTNGSKWYLYCANAISMAADTYIFNFTNAPY